MTRQLLLLAVAGVGLGGSGCRLCRRDAGLDREPRPYLPPPPGGNFLMPPAGARVIPPTTLPVTPAPAGTVVPPVGPSNYPPPNMPLDTAPPAAIPLVAPPPASGKVLIAPDPLPGGMSRTPADAPPGWTLVPPPIPALPPATAAPAVPATTAYRPPADPVGVSGFVRVSATAAAGRKPTLDGFDALRRAGYKTAVYAHAPGDDPSAARRVATDRGLAFVPVAVSADTLQMAYDEFARLLADPAAGPVFVFDDTGSRGGALWYLHFRKAESLNADAARVRAKPLGYDPAFGPVE